MKKFLLLFTIISCVFIEAQTYTFDYVLSYKSYNKKNPEKDSSTFEVLLNSSNKDYYLSIYKKNGNAHFLDDKNKRMHNFSSFKDNSGKYYFNHTSEIFGIADYESKVTLKKRKKDLFSMKRVTSTGAFRSSAYKVDFIIAESEVDLLFISDEGTVNMTTKNVEKLKKLINSDKNYIVSKVISDYKGNASIYELVGYEKIDLTIAIPETEE